MTSSSRLTRAARTVTTSRRFQQAALGFAAATRRAMVLVYHRVGVTGSGRHEIVPRISTETLRDQIVSLQDLGEIVSLDQLLSDSPRSSRIRFALTLDDDHPSHSTEVVPLLKSLGIEATFFLSGRACVGLGPYWFELLETALEREQPASLARRLGLTGASAQEIARRCEVDEGLQRALIETVDPEAESLDERGIGAISAAGMTVGFHTLHHQVLTGLDDAALRQALVEGRARLEAVAGQGMRFFAYPHGKADGRVASFVQTEGFAAAFTGQPGPVTKRTDRFLVGRWEPGPLDNREFIRRLSRWLVDPRGRAARAASK